MERVNEIFNLCADLRQLLNGHLTLFPQTVTFLEEKLKSLEIPLEELERSFDGFPADIDRHHKISIIKWVRCRTGVNLNVAKEAVERMFTFQPLS